MPVTDASAFIGDYPYRGITSATATWLLSQMDRLGIDSAWVGYLPSFLHRDAEFGNSTLEKALAPHRDRLLPVPVVNPCMPGWEQELNRAVEMSAAGVRVYPMHSRLDSTGGEMRVLAAAAGSVRLPLVLTVKFEDSRQRHPSDLAADLPPAGVRALIRSDTETRILVTNADKAFVEEVHFGLTPGEAARLLWDCSWIWGPPENQLQSLLETVGVDRFAFGSGMPLRIPDATLAKVDLLDLSDEDREGLLGGSLLRWNHRFGG